MSIDKNRNLTVQKLKLPETLRKSVRVLSQRQMISKPIRSGILIMRMEISVRYPIRPPKMEFRHCLIFMMRTDGCRRSKENCIPRGRQQRKSSEVIPMIRLEDWSKQWQPIIRKMTRQKQSHIPMIMLETGSKKMTEQRQHRILITDWIS